MITKKIFSICLIAALGSTLAFAQDEGDKVRKKKKRPAKRVAEDVGLKTDGYKYGPAGCGLGSFVFEPNAGFMQVFAATTNGTAGSQTFGISFGTSNCNSPSASETAYEQEIFMNANIASLSKEAAQGDGATLRAFAELLGCSDQYSAFSSLGQEQYTQIFANPEQANVVLANYKSAIGTHPMLADSCIRAQRI